MSKFSWVSISQPEWPSTSCWALLMSFWVTTVSA
jgi:hypothetical protein